MINVVVQVKDGIVISGPWYFPEDDQKLYEFTDKLGGIIDPFDEDNTDGALVLPFGHMEHFEKLRKSLKKPMHIREVVELWDKILS